MRSLRYFSTFTGIGGLDMGLEELGAKCVGYSEIKESSIKIYSHHYPDHVNFGDITQIDPKEIPDFDVFVGGFPCQSFSIAGLRGGFKDRRGRMIFYIYDILKEKKPEFVVLENVKAIATHNGGKTIESVIHVLKDAGYHTRVLLLNSAHYGSAQGRERIIFIGRRGKPFEAKNPEIVDDTKRFRDVRAVPTDKEFLSETVLKRMERVLKEGGKGFEFVGGYDRVNTLTTGVASSGRQMLVTQEKDGRFRRLSCLEAERLQGFPEGWTEPGSVSERWFALGNAVNCDVSRYLFKHYLDGLWWKV